MVLAGGGGGGVGDFTRLDRVERRMISGSRSSSTATERLTLSSSLSTALRLRPRLLDLVGDLMAAEDLDALPGVAIVVVVVDEEEAFAMLLVFLLGAASSSRASARSRSYSSFLSADRSSRSFALSSILFASSAARRRSSLACRTFINPVPDRATAAMSEDEEPVGLLRRV